MADRLAEIEARLDALPPEEWKVGGSCRHECDYPCGHYSYPIMLNGAFEIQNLPLEDVTLVMHAPQDLRDLLAVAKASREFIDEYRDMNGGEEPDDPITRRVADALANLEGGA